MLYRNPLVTTSIACVQRLRRVAVRRRGRVANAGRSSPVVYGCAVALAMASGSASSANWEVAPVVEVGYLYNDNYHLELPGGEIDVSGAQADVAVTFRTVDPRTTVSLTPRIRSTYFPNESDEDSNDYFFNVRIDDETPRRRTGLAAEYSQEDVVRSEFPGTEVEGGLGDPDVLDSGHILRRSRRDLVRVAPYFSYDATQRTTLELEARYIDVSYDETLEGFLQDFREIGLVAGAAFRVTPRSSVAVRGEVAQFETSTDADAYGAHVEWAVDYSPTSRFYLRLGGQRTEPERGDTDNNFIAGIGGRWQSQRNRLFLDFTRTVGPVSAGTIVERHQLRFRLNHDISERVTALIGARISRNESIEEESTYPTREYAAAEAGIEWRIQRQWALFGSYTYRWQEYSDEPTDASANGFLIGVRYEPRRVR